jgi:hypothetical protein
MNAIHHRKFSNAARPVPNSGLLALVNERWGNSSIRVELYGSVFYAMFSRQRLKIRHSHRYAIAPMNQGDNAS